jgi:hypothetical protein
LNTLPLIRKVQVADRFIPVETPAFFDVLQKTYIEGNVVVQIETKVVKNPTESILKTPIYLLFQKL